MTWIDWVIAGLLSFSTLQGLRRGIVITLLGALAVIVAYLAASVWYLSLTEVLVRRLLLPRAWAATAAFAFLLISGVAILRIAVTILLETYRLSVSSRVLGGLAGAAKGALLSMVWLAVALASPLGDPVQRDVKNSVLAPYAVRAQQAGVKSLAVVLPIHPFGAKETRF